MVRVLLKKVVNAQALFFYTYLLFGDFSKKKKHNKGQ